MSWTLLGALGVALGLGALGLALFLRWGARWGATSEECSMPMAGDAWLTGDRRARVRMTRAITVGAPLEVVWAWLAQMGRGAGWYSVDRLDNGGRVSARHLVSWIPRPRLGDASAIGYLKHLEPGRELAWWIPGDRLLGSTVRSVMAYRVSPVGDRARLVARFAWDAEGWTGWPVLRFFQLIDTIMARHQLLNLRRRAERCGARTEDPEASETGARDQFQLYEVLYASGERAGRAGEEKAAKWRRAAIDEGLLPAGQAGLPPLRPEP